MYQITDYTLKKAKELGVVVKPSTNPKKKLDVFKKGSRTQSGLLEKVASIGAIGYKDYPTYLKTEGKEVADKRRKLYKLRHQNDNGINGYYADKLL